MAHCTIRRRYQVKILMALYNLWRNTVRYDTSNEKNKPNRFEQWNIRNTESALNRFLLIYIRFDGSVNNRDRDSKRRAGKGSANFLAEISFRTFFPCISLLVESNYCRYARAIDARRDNWLHISLVLDRFKKMQISTFSATY